MTTIGDALARAQARFFPLSTRRLKQPQPSYKRLYDVRLSYTVKPSRWWLDGLHLHDCVDRWHELQEVTAWLDQFADGSTDLLHYAGLYPS